MYTKNINFAEVHNANYRVHSAIFVSVLIYFLQVKKLNFIILYKRITSDALVKSFRESMFSFL